MNYEENRLLEIFSHRNGASFLDSEGWHYSRQRLTDDEVLNHWADSEVAIALGFGSTTQYLMLDIDHGSLWHPANNECNYRCLLKWMAQLGLCCPVVVRSSLSMGLHIYFPLPEPVHPRRLAVKVEQHLNKRGAALADGTLELFPNPTKKVDGQYAAYKRHRLPMQSGGGLLEGEYLLSDLSAFVQAWKVATDGNSIDGCQARFGARADFEAWRSSMERLLKSGWESQGQTNELLGRLASWFLVSEQLLSVEALAKRMVEAAISMPGFEQFCSHAHEIEQRCISWAESALRRHYARKVQEPEDLKLSNWNKLRSDGCLARIKAAFLKLRTNDDWLTLGKTKRLQAIAQAAEASVNSVRKYWPQLKEDHTPQGSKEQNENTGLSVRSHPPEKTATQSGAKLSGGKDLGQVEDRKAIKNKTLVGLRKLLVRTADTAVEVPVPVDALPEYRPDGVRTEANPNAILSALWPSGEVLGVACV